MCTNSLFIKFISVLFLVCAISFFARTFFFASHSTKEELKPAPVTQKHWVGVWPGPNFIENPNKSIADFKKLSNSSPAVISIYQPWASSYNNQRLWQTEWVDSIENSGSVPMVSWESDNWNTSAANDPKYSLDKIIRGDFDQYISEYAKSVAAWGHPFLLRFDWEMNGNWYPWSVQNNTNGNTPAKYVLAWKHVHDLFVRQSAKNAYWVWCPDASQTGVSYSSIYPGDAYVDYGCLDGYNNSKNFGDFSKIFGAAYAEITAVTKKPLIIGEVASSEEGGSKSDFINNAYNIEIPQKFPTVQGVIWFNENKESNWTINSSSSSLVAYRSAVQNIYWNNKLNLSKR